MKLTVRRPAGLAITGVVLVGAAFLLGLWIVLRGNDPFFVDSAWNDFLVSWHVPAVTTFGLVMGWLGGGWFAVFAVPLGGALVLFLLRRFWGAVFFLAAEVASAAGVQLLKHLFGRTRPEEILVISDYGSFPSGHTANAATLAAVLVILFPRLWVAIAGAVWILLMAFARTAVHAHWLSDTLGGALLGIGVVLLVAAAFAAQLAREDEHRARAVDASQETPSLG